MPIDTRHKDYKESAPIWQRCRDVVAGEDAVKAGKEKYLPKLEGQSDDEYKAYLARGLFYNATSRTIQGTSGAIFRKPTLVEPENPYVEESAQNIVDEILETGRFGLLVDLPADGGEPYFVGYKAEQIINWRYETIGDEQVLTMVVLEEVYEEADPEDPYVLVEKVRYRELLLNEDAIYQQVVHNKVVDDKGKESFQVDPPIIPTVKGEPLSEIQFIFFGATELSADVDKPPLLDLVNANLSHYRTSCDLEHGRHFTALPTAWVAGFPKESTLRIGAGTAWVTENVNAKAGFLEFTGQGLGALDTAMTEKKELMASLGARLFANSKGGVEAAETVRLRQSADTATASSIANLVSKGLTKAYQMYLAFQRTQEGTTAVVQINTDVLDATMSADDAIKLVSLWQQRGISRHTLLWNLKQGEILPPDQTLELEAAMIDVEQGTFVGLPDSDNPFVQQVMNLIKQGVSPMVTETNEEEDIDG